MPPTDQEIKNEGLRQAALPDNLSNNPDFDKTGPGTVMLLLNSIKARCEKELHKGHAEAFRSEVRAGACGQCADYHHPQSAEAAGSSQALAGGYGTGPEQLPQLVMPVRAKSSNFPPLLRQMAITADLSQGIGLALLAAVEIRQK